jgi:hypothetical protein
MTKWLIGLGFAVACNSDDGPLQALSERRRGISVSKECLDNPLAKGCP